MRSRALLLGSILASILVAACAPQTKMVSTWTAPNYRQGSVKKVLVIGVAPDGALRRTFEESFVKNLEDAKYVALPGYLWIPNPDPKTVDRDAIEKKIREAGVTHVLATRIVDRKTVETYVPPTVATVGVGAPGYYGSWYSYYSVGYTTVASPGYVTREDVYSLETNLWDVSTGERVWTGLSQTWVGEAPESNLKAVISRVTYELRSKKIL